LSEAKGKSREGGLGDFSVRKNTTSQIPSLASYKKVSYTHDMKSESVHEVKQHLDTCTCNGTCAVIDVRAPFEHAAGRIPGATNIPLNELTDRTSELHGKEVVYVHCRSGGRSSMAAQLLHDMGVKGEIVNVAGGLTAWESAGFPVEK
jgi:rhodanese-related sulfurtransferase